MWQCPPCRKPVEGRLGGLRSHGIIGDIHGKGLFLGIEFVRDPSTREPFPQDVVISNLIGRRALENGLLTRFDPRWIALGPPLILTEDQAGEIVSILDRRISEVMTELIT